VFNKATAERQAAVAAFGKTPLEIMMKNARWAYDKAMKLTAVLFRSDAPQDEETQATDQGDPGCRKSWQSLPFGVERPSIQRTTGAGGEPPWPAVTGDDWLLIPYISTKTRTTNMTLRAATVAPKPHPCGLP
jgi:hypothetical protein